MSKSLLFTAAVALAVAALLPVAAAVQAAGLPTTPAQVSGRSAASGYDGVVEAVRQTVIAAQVPGAVVELAVKLGDRVAAGQLLLRIDARTADQAAAASDAQVQAARAALTLASQEFNRQQQLFQKQYISQAALERADSEFKAAQAQANAQLAQAGAARTQTGLHVVRAPYAGVVAELPVSLGDMAMPGRPLLTLYDPSALRVSASVPQTVATRLAAGDMPRVELPGLPPVAPLRLQQLPTADAATHTITLRLDLPANLVGVSPGMFARLWLPTTGAAVPGAAATLSVPRTAIVRRAEMTGLYVLDAQGRPLLRQVRLGRVDGDRIEILSGLVAGEAVVTDPQAAARAANRAPAR